MLQDLVMAAINEATRKVERGDEIKKKTWAECSADSEDFSSNRVICIIGPSGD